MINLFQSRDPMTVSSAEISGAILEMTRATQVLSAELARRKSFNITEPRPGFRSRGGVIETFMNVDEAIIAARKEFPDIDDAAQRPTMVQRYYC